MQHCNKIFWAFCALHVAIWTIGSTLCRGSVTHDTLEGIAWGLQWQLGYDKHPFIAAWLSAVATKLGGSVGWPVYLLSQLAVITTFLSVFQLAKKIFTPQLALLSVLLLEGILYFNINSINLTPDTMQTPFWALLTLFFYDAVKKQTLKYWTLVAIFAALALLTKYSIALLLLSMLLVCCITPDGKKSFTNKNCYLALGLFIVLISPHLIWSYKQNLTGINYIKDSINGDVNYIKYPLRYIASQLGVLAGMLLLSWPLFFAKREQTLAKKYFDKTFLIIMGLGPFIITIIFGIISGTKTIPRWSTPYFYLYGILLLLWLKPILTKKIFKQFIITAIIITITICIARNSYFIWSPSVLHNTRSDAFLPNKQIAAKITSIWQTHYNTPLKYIAGDHYLTAYIASYAKSHPAPYMDFSSVQSPWINEDDLRKHGAVFAWENNIPFDIKQRFPNMKIIGEFSFAKLVNIKTKPISITIAILPPSSINLQNL